MMFIERASLGIFEGGRGKAVRAIAAITCLFFIVQWIVDSRTGGVFQSIFGLSLRGLMSGDIWVLVTYLLVHAGWWHLLTNMLGLVIFGPDVEEVLGVRRFVLAYLVCGLAGGLGWLAISGRSGMAICVGASGAVLGVLGAFAAIFPGRPVVLFPFPVAVTARVLILILAGAAIFSMVLNPGNVAHMAHLAGGVAGYVFGRTYGRFGVPFADRPAAGRNARRGSRSWLAGVRDMVRRKTGQAVEEEHGAMPTRDEIDKVLDKITAKGIGSLSKRDREVLLLASRKPR